MRCCTNELPNQCKTFNVFADVLIWKAAQSGAENWAQVFETSDNVVNVDILRVSFGCDVGFRAGFGWCLPCDQWDTQLYYTRFHTEGKDRASTNGEIASSFLGNFYIANSDGLKTGPTYQKAAIEWTISFNVFDWELGRDFCICQDFSLRPFIGLKGGWINQTIDSKWQTPIFPNPDPFFPPIPFDRAEENLKNHFWGIGPSTGLNLKCEWATFCRHSFSLFGDFSGALLYGHWDFRDFYQNDKLEEVSIDVPNINGAAAMLRGFVGIGWATDFNNQQQSFSVKLGYEAQFWLSQLQFYSLNTGRLNNELTLQGGTVDFQFNF